MYIANIKTTNQWQSVEDLIETATGESFTFDADTTYHLTNNSAHTVFLVNDSTKPSEDVPLGMGLPPATQCDFKVGIATKLFVLSPIEPGDVCVEVEG